MRLIPYRQDREKRRRCVFAACSFLFLCCPVFAQPGNHPTVKNVSMAYKAVPTPTVVVTPASPVGIYAIPTATIRLKDPAAIRRVYFKILDENNSNAVLFQAQYRTDTATVTDGAGNVLFEAVNQELHISPGQVMALGPYKLSVTTRDTAQAVSSIFLDHK